jgi:hypothetical protein
MGFLPVGILYNSKERCHSRVVSLACEIHRDPYTLEFLFRLSLDAFGEAS